MRAGSARAIRTSLGDSATAEGAPDGTVDAMSHGHARRPQDPAPTLGRWARLADPALTPASRLVHERPLNGSAYMHLCARADLPPVLLDRMVEQAARDFSRVRQSALVNHLTTRDDLSVAQLERLWSALGESRFCLLAFNRLVRHRNLTPDVLLLFVFQAAVAETGVHPGRRSCVVNPDDDGPGIRTAVLEGLDSRLVDDAFRIARAVVSARQTTRPVPYRAGDPASAGAPLVTAAVFPRTVRALRVAGPAAVAFAERTLPTWAGTRRELLQVAAAAAQRAAAATATRPGSRVPTSG